MSEPQSTESIAATPTDVPAVMPCHVASAKDTEAGKAIETQAPTIASTSNAAPPASWLWLSTLDQKFVGGFVAVFLMLSGYHWVTLSGWGTQPIEIERLSERTYDFRIDINSASWVEWTQIEGIGQVMAEKIVADRDSKGAFRSVEDLRRVKGIGTKTLEKMRPFLHGPNEQDAPVKVKQ